VNFTNYSILGYGGYQDENADQYEIVDGGRSLHLWGNNWKVIKLNYEVTSNTVIEFDFMSDGAQGEINGIGLDVDLYLSPDQIFQIYGTQTWGLQAYHNYPGSGWMHMVIPVGQFYTGSIKYLSFANDADNGQETSVYFRDVKLYEGL
jgi:hypothetical protein